MPEPTADLFIVAQSFPSEELPVTDPGVIRRARLTIPNADFIEFTEFAAAEVRSPILPSDLPFLPIRPSQLMEFPSSGMRLMKWTEGKAEEMGALIIALTLREGWVADSPTSELDARIPLFGYTRGSQSRVIVVLPDPNGSVALVQGPIKNAAQGGA